MPAIIGPDASVTWPGGRPSLAPNSVPLSMYRGGLALDGRSVSFAGIYRTQPWVASAVHGIARQIARLPLHAFAMAADGENRERDRGSTLARLLKRPNPEHARSPLALKWDVALGLLLNGNALERIGKPAAGAEPDRLSRLDWRFITPHVLEDGGPVAAWEYRPPNGPTEWLGPEEVVHFAWGTTEGPIGVSPLTQLGVTLRSEDSAQRYGESSFRNGARMGVGVVLEKGVTADDMVRSGIRDELMLAHGGVDRAFTPLVLGGGVADVKPLGGQSAVEAELINQRKVNREEIAAVYGMPPPLIGILDHATYSNVSELHKMLYRTVLGPWLSLYAETLGEQLIGRTPSWEARGAFVEFELGEVLKGDTRERMDAYRTAIAAGVLTLNDVRRLENLKPYESEWADEPLVMANNVLPLSMIGDQAAAGATSLGGELEKALRSTLEDLVAEELAAAGLNGESRARAEAVTAAALARHTG